MAVNNAVNLVPTISGTANQISVSPAGPTAVPTIGTASTQLSTTQPMFSAYTSANQLNVTGDGTSYTVLFDTTTTNQGANYNTGTGIFTAPVTGNYLFCAGTEINNGAATTSNILLLRITSGDYTLTLDTIVIAIGQTFTMGNSVIVNMSATDTASIIAIISGGTKTSSVLGGFGKSFFSGFLLH